MLTLDMPELIGNAVHVWALDIANHKGEMDRFERLLNKYEWQRAEKFVFEKDRHAFIIRQAVLKELLEGYLDIKAEEVYFEFDEYGKPRMDAGVEMHFNLSHSDGMVMYAFSKDQDVGVDIERMREGVEFDKIVENYFSDIERDVYFGFRRDERAKSFYTGWTRKEAYLKAIGLGLSKSLDKFSVSMVPNSSGGVIKGDEDWWVVDVDCPDEYQAAMSTFGELDRVDYFKVHTIEKN